jgi:HrpA-like RNA helicase
VHFPRFHDGLHNLSTVPEPLPITPRIPEILARIRESRAAVITAAPGTGKTTRVPPALAADGPVIVLQPRRVAARSIAARIAAEQGWTLGREVGWHVRFERKFVPETRLLVATEGILTARLQRDPRSRGNAADRRPSGAGAAPAARAKRPAGTDDQGSSKLLGADLP